MVMLLGWRRSVAKLQGQDPDHAPETPAPSVAPMPASITIVPGRHLNHVPGFKANGVWAQIKKKSRDVALIVSDRPSKGAAVFTQNAFCAAPVLVSRENVENGDIRAIVCNAGNANAVGSPGTELEFAL